ncbi:MULTISPECIES: dTDP-4-dehydrorhamnose reductase [unclassified Paenibacillus]|uniref:dTDP-4-dehydrorhamnose reductase n=1 Tax=unclassified Paenibacillus TaxID=185978 RepID=UPI000710E6B8|nr:MULTISPECIES: dTDP-4-dehydrorhamnose reductase [unclassified Paenibacillus]KQX49179.1 NAD(P)-dependent oxidoreductase [Paenibacillus sp. Root444D2]KRE48645.1 NAD(P)-dependent oxidoreductase [Paenibacillus sp. Soil724D2]
MKILITGAGGQLGYDLNRVFRPVHDITAWRRDQLDVSDEKRVMDILLQEHPDVVIHAAAYTNVDKAEVETELAYQVNALGPLHIAKACEQIGAKLVYVSTDYVFDGTKGTPYDERDITNPNNVYGHSKLLGEKFVRMTCSKHFVVRTSWLYGTKGANFVTKVLEKARSGEPLSIVDDQFGSPTYCLDLAIFLRELIETDRYGIYHASNQGVCSRYEFATHILKVMQMEHVPLIPVPSDLFPMPAVRPMYSAFHHKAISDNGFTPMRDWKSALNFFLQVDHDYPAVVDKKV